MGVGLKSGLEKKFGANVTVELNSIVSRKGGNDITDIDAAVVFANPVSVANDLFPTSNLSIRPEACYSLTGQKFAIEIKRSVGTKQFAAQKIDRCVNAWNTILTTPLFAASDLVRDIMQDKNAVLIFLFNGEDMVEVEQYMRTAVHRVQGGQGDCSDTNPIKLYGRTVLCVWCKSADLESWKDILEKNELAREKEEFIRREAAAAREKEDLLFEKEELLLEKEELLRERESLMELLRRNNIPIDIPSIAMPPVSAGQEASLATQARQHQYQPAQERRTLVQRNEPPRTIAQRNEPPRTIAQRNEPQRIIVPRHEPRRIIVQRNQPQRTVESVGGTQAGRDKRPAEDRSRWSSSKRHKR